MLEKYAAYFRDIEMPQALQERADQLCSEYITLLAGDVDHVFIDDYYDDQSIRRYNSMFIVAGGILSELRSFISDSNIDFVKLSRAKWVTVRKYELGIVSGVTTPRSRMEVDVAFVPEVNAEFRASHNNCLYLWNFLREVILPILE
jgi:hypothetical protein